MNTRITKYPIIEAGEEVMVTTTIQKSYVEWFDENVEKN
jgi:hypothetical protein